MNGFGYWRDGLFLVTSASYVVNRWVLQSLFPSPFLRGHFNDLLLLPAALPLVLWLQRLGGLRTHDHAPSWAEMIVHLAVWSVICEWVGPRFLGMGTADVWDIVAYATGGVAACLWWRGHPQRRWLCPS